MTSFDPKAYWATRAKAYRDTMQTEYNKSRLAMIDALIGPDGLKGSVVDFGCGDGIHATACAAQGGTIIAIDIDPSMVDTTREGLAPFASDHKVLEGGVDVLSKLLSASCDAMLALNVLAYLDDNQCDEFYRQASRIVKPGGKLILTHSNELFDLFTFNKYTVAFYSKHFGVEGIENLIVNWDKPERWVLPTRENPLAYRHKLHRYGFSEEVQEFSIPHSVPPLLETGFNPDDLATRKVGIAQGTPTEEQWKLNFTCSIFGSRSVRT